MDLARYLTPYAVGLLVLILATIVLIWTGNMEAFLTLAGAGSGIMGGGGIAQFAGRRSTDA